MNKLYKEFFFFPDISILIALIATGVGVSIWKGLTLGMILFLSSEC